MVNFPAPAPSHRTHDSPQPTTANRWEDEKRRSPSLRLGSQLGGGKRTDLKGRRDNGRSKKRRHIGAVLKVLFRGAGMLLVARLDFVGVQWQEPSSTNWPVAAMAARERAQLRICSSRGSLFKASVGVYSCAVCAATKRSLSFFMLSNSLERS